jgi:hypothetical protein
MITQIRMVERFSYAWDSEGSTRNESVGSRTLYIAYIAYIIAVDSNIFLLFVIVEIYVM